VTKELYNWRKSVPLEISNNPALPTCLSLSDRTLLNQLEFLWCVGCMFPQQLMLTSSIAYILRSFSQAHLAASNGPLSNTCLSTSLTWIPKPGFESNKVANQWLCMSANYRGPSVACLWKERPVQFLLTSEGMVSLVQTVPVNAAHGTAVPKCSRREAWPGTSFRISEQRFAAPCAEL
jgi:hypothetical protein